jgi:hypothetical protein
MIIPLNPTIQLNHINNHKHVVFLLYLLELEAKITKLDEAKSNPYPINSILIQFFTLSILSKQELLYLKIFVTALTAFSVAVLFSTERLSAALITANNGGKASAHARA